MENANKLIISVVLSFINEEEVISELVRRLRAVFKTIGCKYELIFVNDASTDRSLAVLLEERALVDDIKIINMSRTFGHMPGIFAGIKAATGDAVIYMDSDLQDPPELIPSMIEAWQSEEEVEVVYTTRNSRAGESVLKLWVTKLGYKLLRYTTDIEVVVNSGDFKLLSRRAVNELAKFGEKKPFFRFLVSWIGFKQKQIFYDREPRYAGRSKFFFFSRKVATQFLEISLVPFSDFPLRVSLFFGFITSVLSFTYLIVIVVMNIAGLNLPGWSAIMATMLLLGGVQLTVMGMLGLYIGAIYNEAKGRPNYIVEDKIGFPDSND